MPAKSKAQQRFFGMVLARKRGKRVGGPEVAKVARSISMKDAEEFAKTKHKGLPERVEKKKKCKHFMTWKEWLQTRETN